MSDQFLIAFCMRHQNAIGWKLDVQIPHGHWENARDPIHLIMLVVQLPVEEYDSIHVQQSFYVCLNFTIVASESEARMGCTQCQSNAHEVLRCSCMSPAKPNFNCKSNVTQLVMRRYDVAYGMRRN